MILVQSAERARRFSEDRSHSAAKVDGEADATPAKTQAPAGKEEKKEKTESEQKPTKPVSPPQETIRGAPGEDEGFLTCGEDAPSPAPGDEPHPTERRISRESVRIPGLTVDTNSDPKPREEPPALDPEKFTTPRAEGAPELQFPPPSQRVSDQALPTVDGEDTGGKLDESMCSTALLIRAGDESGRNSARHESTPGKVEEPQKTVEPKPKPHADEAQVQKDVDRSLHNFDFYNTLNEETSAICKRQLKEMIMELLCRNDFHYYQGYNDICSVFLLIMGKKHGCKAAEIASQYLIKYLFDSAFAIHHLAHFLNLVYGLSARLV